MARFVASFCCVLLLISSVPAAAEAVERDAELRVVHYPVPDEEYGQQFDEYFLELLKLALDRSDLDYRLKPEVFASFREARSELWLQRERYDVHWLNTNNQREANLIPVRIPLYKGLIGWRLLLVREQERDKFAGVTQLEDMLPCLTVQGHDWPDAEILAVNGFNVIRSPSWEGMFGMLAHGRVDFFPRAITEVWNELVVFDQYPLAVEQNVALVYPAAYYFFVSPGQPELAAAIEQGLNVAIADGTFDEVFYRYMGEYIDRAELDRRNIIELRNPLLSSQTPFDRKELWFQPSHLQ